MGSGPRAVGGSEERPAAILDIDGTLVDTNYHHAIAWYRALRRHGCVRPLWVLHRHIGMGGDQLLAAVAGEDFDREHGDDVRETEAGLYMDLIDEVEPLPGARQLLRELRGRGCRIVLASSAKQEEVQHYLELLEAGDIPYTSSADVERTKPEPDLVRAALDKVGGGPAVMIGDSVWDCQAARRAGVVPVGVLTGGFSDTELREAGAESVFGSLEQLSEHLGDLPLSG